jgi:hypothetical protein
MGGHGVAIHTNKNQLTQNIFLIAINVKGDYVFLTPNADFNHYVLIYNGDKGFSVPGVYHCGKFAVR